MQQPSLWSINAGGRASDAPQLHAMVDILESFSVEWAACMVCEADGKLQHAEHPASQDGTFVSRAQAICHWPGGGSRAMTLLINSKMLPLISGIEWMERNARVDFKLDSN